MNSRHTRPPATPRGPVAPLHRGPQAVTHAMLGSAIHHAPNAALLIDFDNVTMGIQKDLQQELRNLLSSDIIKGKVAVQRAYADWRRYPQYIVPLAESSIDMIMAPAYGSSKKNATDIRLAVDAMELVFTRNEIGTFILLSGDSDFSTLVIKLKEYGKYVIGVGIRESASDLLVMNCDEYYSYNSLAGLVRTADEEHKKYDPWELVSEAIARMKRNGDVMRADRLKQVMQDIDSSFDEKNLGMAKFSRFVQEAAHKGLLTLTKLENGQFEVGPPHQAAATAAALPADGERLADAAEERPRRDRGRGRGGRGRDRDRGERDDARPAATPADVAAVAPDAEAPRRDGAGERAAPERGPGRDHERRPRRDHVAPVAAAAGDAAADEIGLGGERLTRQEAFDLVRRAVESLVSGDDAVSARRVREQAFAVLGRDSESLSERNFSRILKDAHDADLIDLRRRGDDYEVARAAEAAPVAEQLNRAAAAQQPQAPAGAPAAPRGMGPRGVSGPARRGRGMLGRGPIAPPADLLSIGVVEVEPTTAAAAASAAPLTVPAPGAESAPMLALAPAAEERPARGRVTATAPRQDEAEEAAPAPRAAAKRGRAAARGGATRGRARKTAMAADAAAAPAAEPPAAVSESGEAEAPRPRPRRPRARKAAARPSE